MLGRRAVTDLTDDEILRRATAIRRKQAAARRRQKVGRDTRQARTAAPGQRKPREHDEAYRQWINALPCVACAVTWARNGLTPRWWPRSEAAHVRAGYADEPGWPPTGAGQKPSDYRCLPLCDSHHRTSAGAQHQSHERGWWARLGVYPPRLCADLRTTYESNQDGTTIILIHAEGAK